MSATPAELRELWGPVGQIGYVVSDIETAARRWTESIGLGPWQIFTHAPIDVLNYEGKPTEATIGMALAFMGDVQIELIEQHNDAPSMYREVLDTYGDGAQHICFYPDDYEGALDAGRRAGMTVAQHGQMWGIDFAYMRGDGGRVIELANLGEKGKAMRARSIEAAASWDGSDPYRYH